MADPPTGTITFLFTDLERSAHQWEQRPQAMQDALARHDALVRAALETEGRHVFKTVGDAFHAAFPTAPEALRVAVAIQRALAAEPWQTGEPLRARIALHTGTAQQRDDDYFGPALNRVARLRDAGHGGQILLSGVTATLVRSQTPEGVELRALGIHRLRDLTEPEQVYQAAVWGLPADFPPLRTERDRAADLPIPLTSFVGREKELDEVARLLGTARLVTLTAPGGAGKTRLALAMAERIREDYPDGVWFADLSPIADPGLVASAVAQALGVREGEGRSPTDSLTAYLREKRLLLVLDNFEQVVEAAPLARDLLVAAPGLTVLVTSRTPLRLSAEQEYAVPPLPAPDPSRLPTADRLHEYAAVALFEQRARAVRADFAVTAENAEAVAEICARLDGLPLAIELAAARIRLLSPDAIRARLGERLKLLVGGARDLPGRQRTLRNTIAWSYDLLTPDEQTIFRRLAVFASGCTLDAAEAVCDTDADPRVDVVDTLASLVEKSLVRQVDGPEGESRFTMLETIREFAREQFAGSGEADTIGRRFADYFRALAESAEPAFYGPDDARVERRLDAERDNLRAALAWAATTDEAEIGLTTAAAIYRWFYNVSLSEGRRWIEQFLESLPDAAARTRARGLSARAGLAWFQNDFGEARRSAAESIAIWRGLPNRERGDLRGLAEALSIQAMAMLDDPDAGCAIAEAGLALARELDEPRPITLALMALGILATRRQDWPTARAAYEEGLAVQRPLGVTPHLAALLGNLGVVAMCEGDLATAAALSEEALALRRPMNMHFGLLGNLLNLTMIACARGDAETAAGWCSEGLELGHRLGWPSALAGYLEAGAWVAALHGRQRESARIAGAAVAVRERRPLIDLRDPVRGAYLDAIEEVRITLGGEFERYWDEGRALSLDAAIALALEQTAGADDDV